VPLRQADERSEGTAQRREDPPDTGDSQAAQTLHAQTISISISISIAGINNNAQSDINNKNHFYKKALIDN